MTNQTLLIEYAPRCPSPVLKFPDAHPCKGRDLLHHTNRPGSIHKIAENLRNNVNNPKYKFKVCVCVWGGGVMVFNATFINSSVISWGFFKL